MIEQASQRMSSANLWPGRSGQTTVEGRREEIKPEEKCNRDFATAVIEPRKSAKPKNNAGRNMRKKALA